MDRPLIGVTGPRPGGHVAWWFTRLAVWLAGGRALRLRPGGRDDAELDGLIIGGGADIEPARYGQTPAAHRRAVPDPERDRFELEWLARAVRRDLPVLGICRGAQLINVFFGGDLYQDIREAADLPAVLRTAWPHKPIRLSRETRIGSIMDCPRARINSLHTQSVRNVGEGLRISATDEYGIVQAVEAPDHPFLLGVQWHPEYIPQSVHHRNLFSALVEASELDHLRRTGRRGEA